MWLKQIMNLGFGSSFFHSYGLSPISQVWLPAHVFLWFSSETVLKLFFYYSCKKKTYPKDLPTISVVLIFMNEALSIILRAITSIINRTPAHLLKEIILVDDYSSNGKWPGEGRSLANVCCYCVKWMLVAVSIHTG